jgi:hypothetical protein
LPFEPVAEAVEERERLVAEAVAAHLARAFFGLSSHVIFSRNNARACAFYFRELSPSGQLYGAARGVVKQVGRGRESLPVARPWGS